MIISGTIWGNKAQGGAGGPLPNAVYYIKDATGNIVSEIGYTDDAGNFSVEIYPGEFLTAAKEGYNPQDYQAEDLQNGISLFLYAKEADLNKLLPVAGLAAAGIYFATRKKKRVGKLETKDLAPWGLIGAGLLGFTFLRQLLEKLGIWDSADTKELNTDATDPGSPWNPNYWRQFTTYSYAITQSTGNTWAQEIYDAFGAFNDCEECAKAVFRRCRTKANLSFLVWCFNNVYGQDLLSFLRGGYWPQDRLSDADVNEINNYIKNLPNS